MSRSYDDANSIEFFHSVFDQRILPFGGGKHFVFWVLAQNNAEEAQALNPY